jgi:uncharacterized membrane protein
VIEVRIRRASASDDELTVVRHPAIVRADADGSAGVMGGARLAELGVPAFAAVIAVFALMVLKPV